MLYILPMIVREKKTEVPLAEKKKNLPTISGMIYLHRKKKKKDNSSYFVYLSQWGMTEKSQKTDSSLLRLPTS